MSIKKILVPTDFSDTAYSALEFAADIAVKSNAEITLLHAYQLSESGQIVMINLTDILEKDSKTGLDDTIKKILSESQYQQLKITPVSKMGFLDDVIKAVHNQTPHDLMVMGTTGAGNNLNAVFGSNTTKIMKKTNIPLVTIPGQWMSGEIDSVVAGVRAHDLPDKSRNTVLFELCKIYDSSVYPIHVNQNGGKEPSDEQLQKIKDFFEPYCEKIKVVAGEDPSAKIIEYAEERVADMVTVYRKRYNFLQKLFHSSQSRAMALYGKTPVLVIPFKDE